MIRQIMQMAIDSEGNPRHMDDVDNGVKCECFCPACGHPLVAKNEGEIRAHHYSHLSNVDCEHGYQSSIHLMAKIIFLEMEEFMFIKQGQAVYYKIDQVVLERKIGSIIPDILITCDGKQFMVEIYVTHALDDKKKQKIEAMNISTIEIDLSRFALTTLTREELQAELLKKENISWLHDADEKLIQAKRDILLQYGWKIQVGIGEAVFCPLVAGQKNQFHRYIPMDFCQTCPHHCPDTQQGFIRCGYRIPLPIPVNPRILQPDIFIHSDKVLFSSELREYLRNFDRSLEAAVKRMYYTLTIIAKNTYGSISIPQMPSPRGRPPSKPRPYHREKGDSNDEKIFCIDDKRFDGSVSHLLL